MGSKASNPNKNFIPDQTDAEQIRFQLNLLDAVEQSVIATNLAGQIIYWNYHAEKLYGWRADEVLGRNIVEVTPAPEMLEQAAQIMARLQAGQSWSGEFQVQRRDGSTFPAQVTDSPIYDDTGKLIGIVGVSSDITELKQAEAALRQSEAQLRALTETLEQRVAQRTAELERRNRELDQFTYVASHDLKAPLRVIDNLAAWIAEDAGEVLPERSNAYLDKLRGRVKRMEQLLNDLLVYSRADRLPDEIGMVNTGVLVEEMIELLSPPPGFTITVAESMPIITTARVPLEVTLRNLIDNAIKHHHQAEGHIHISAQDKAEVVEFRVEDDGPGIAEAFHERIFQMFQTLRPRDEIEGSGIGLAVTKKIVESKGGQIGLISAEGQGATFWFTWPKG